MKTTTIPLATRTSFPHRQLKGENRVGRITVYQNADPFYNTFRYDSSSSLLSTTYAHILDVPHVHKLKRWTHSSYSVYQSAMILYMQNSFFIILRRSTYCIVYISDVSDWTRNSFSPSTDRDLQFATLAHVVMANYILVQASVSSSSLSSAQTDNAQQQPIHTKVCLLIHSRTKTGGGP